MLNIKANNEKHFQNYRILEVKQRKGRLRMPLRKQISSKSLFDTVELFNLFRLHAYLNRSV